MKYAEETRRTLADGTTQIWRDDSSCWVTLPSAQRAGEPEGSRDLHIHDACIVDAKAGEPPRDTVRPYDPPVGHRRFAKDDLGVVIVEEWRGKSLGWQRVARLDDEPTAPPPRLETDSAKPYDKERLLDTAKATVAGRGDNYGKPEDNFMRIANHWEMFLANSKGSDKVRFSITPGDVAIMMCLMKIARLENDPAHADSWIDLAGYAACGAEIETTK